MLAKNIDITRGLVNGARGVVVKFDSATRGALWHCLVGKCTHFKCFNVEDHILLGEPVHIYMPPCLISCKAYLRWPSLKSGACPDFLYSSSSIVDAFVRAVSARQFLQLQLAHWV